MITIDPAFWRRLDEFIASHNMVIDRPKGTPHPRYPDLITPVDYGYIVGTAAMDGGGIDLWLGSSGFAQVDGIVCAVDLEKGQVEIKVLYSCTPDEIDTLERLMNSGMMSCATIRRE